MTEQDASFSREVFQQRGAGKIGVAVQQNPEASAERLVHDERGDGSFRAPTHEAAVFCRHAEIRVWFQHVGFAAPVLKIRSGEAVQYRMRLVFREYLTAPAFLQILFQRSVSVLGEDEHCQTVVQEAFQFPFAALREECRRKRFTPDDQRETAGKFPFRRIFNICDSHLFQQGTGLAVFIVKQNVPFDGGGLFFRENMQIERIIAEFFSRSGGKQNPVCFAVCNGGRGPAEGDFPDFSCGESSGP